VLLDLIAEMEQYLGDRGEPDHAPWSGDGVTATFGLRTSSGLVQRFTVIATLGAPLEVNAASLAIETFLPADPDSATKLSQLATAASGAAEARACF